MVNFLLKVVLCADDLSGPVVEASHHTSLHMGRMMGLKVKIPVRVRGLHDLLTKQREEFIRETPTHWAKVSLRGTPGPTISLADRLCSLEMRPTDFLKSGPALAGPAGPATPPLIIDIGHIFYHPIGKLRLW